MSCGRGLSDEVDPLKMTVNDAIQLCVHETYVCLDPEAMGTDVLVDAVFQARSTSGSSISRFTLAANSSSRVSEASY